ncbi:MAG: hypothetical protein ABH862_01145 [Candidatus Omnitrophota bacterium]
MLLTAEDNDALKELSDAIGKTTAEGDTLEMKTEYLSKEMLKRGIVSWLVTRDPGNYPGNAESWDQVQSVYLGEVWKGIVEYFTLQGQSRSTDATADKINALARKTFNGISPFIIKAFNEIREQSGWDITPIIERQNPESHRLLEIDALLLEIDKERQEAGSGDLPEYSVIADFHGEINLFLRYIADTISKNIGREVTLDHTTFPKTSIKTQLEKQELDLKDISLKFNLLGDFLDRGKYGIKCFRAAEELVGLGLANYITGNHDLWAFLNVSGYHLPTYEGYNFYGDLEAEKLVKAHWNDPNIAANRFAWWTEKLAEFNDAQNELQSTLFTVEKDELASSFVDIRKIVKKTFLDIKGLLSPEEKALWEDLAGVYFGSTDVYTGFNGVGKMSLAWWQGKYNEVKKIYDKVRDGDSLEKQTWKDLLQYTKFAKSAVDKQVREANAQGKWWWQVLSSINRQNYDSVEWWGKDWSSHKDWGTSVIQEINEIDDTDHWTQSNYISNRHIKEIASFYRKHFTLFLRDVYGNVYTHGWLPIDVNTGEVGFKYKGTVYRNIDVWKGLERIQSDVRDLNTPLAELHEALDLVNSWYADKTTKIKPEYIEQYVFNVGLEKIYPKLGIKCWFTCHNPINKLQSRGIGFMVKQNSFVHFSVDKGMSWEKFRDTGGYVLVNRDGVKLRGFENPYFKNIVDNPNTMLLEKDEEGNQGIRQSWANIPMGKEAFLEIMRVQLINERNRREAPLPVNESPGSNAARTSGSDESNVLGVSPVISNFIVPGGDVSKLTERRTLLTHTETAVRTPPFSLPDIRVTAGAVTLRVPNNPKIPGISNVARVIVSDEIISKIGKNDETSIFSVIRGTIDEVFFKAVSAEPAEIEISYMRTEEEKIVDVVYASLKQNINELSENEVEIFAPEHLYEKDGAAREEKFLNDKLFNGNERVKITTYQESPDTNALSTNDENLFKIIENSLTRERIPVFVASNSRISAITETSFPEIFKKTRIMAIPDTGTDLKDGEEWFFTRELEGLALLQAALTPKTIEQKENIAIDTRKVLSQLTGRDITLNDLYYMLPYATEGIPAEIKTDSPIAWLKQFIKALLLNMPMQTLDPSEEIEKQRQIKYAA